MTVSGLVLGLLLLTASSSSPKNEWITIKNRSVHDKVLIVEAFLTGNSVELQCSTDQPSCTHLTPGDFVMVRFQSGGLYQDCSNVDIDEKFGTPSKDKPLGQYCFLQP